MLTLPHLPPPPRSVAATLREMPPSGSPPGPRPRAAHLPTAHTPRRTTLSPATPATTAARAATTLPAMVTFGPLISDAPIGLHLDDTRSAAASHVQVRYRNGCVTVDGDDRSLSWMRIVRPARDRLEQNIEAFRDHRSLVFFRTIKEIPKSSELLVWYSDELGRECGIPALTPAHIRGDQQYTCTGCSRSFQFPNCLKAHMRFQCPQQNRPRPRLPHQLSIDALTSPVTSSVTSPLPAAALPEYMARMNALYGAALSAREHSLGGAAHFLQQNAIHGGGSSAFKPHRKSPEIHAPQVTPLDLGVRSHSRDSGHSTSDSDDSARTPTMDDRHVTAAHRKSITPVTHGMANPFQLGLPLYPGACGGLPYSNLYTSIYNCYNPMAAGPVESVMYPSSLYLNGLPRAATPQVPRGAAEKSMMASPPVGSHDDGPHMNHVSFPLPSDKAGEPIDLLPRSLYMNKSCKGHLCIYCGKLYSRKYGLKIHLRTHTGYKPLKCKVCHRPFGDPSNLNKHIRLHAEGDTPYRCDYCGKVLVRRRDLERHIKSRHPNESHEPVIHGLVKDESDVDSDDDLLDVVDDSDDAGLGLDNSEIDVEGMS